MKSPRSRSTRPTADHPGCLAGMPHLSHDDLAAGWQFMQAAPSDTVAAEVDEWHDLLPG